MYARRERNFVLTQALLWAACGTGFTFFMTALGSSIVFFLGRHNSRGFHRLMLGFAAGVMIAASMWSLLIPAIESAQEMGIPGWLPAAGGSAFGTAFLIAIDALLPHFSPSLRREGESHTSSRRAALLALAITMHNIPEGMAVGVSFSLAAQTDPSTLPAAMALAFGIGIQNFPEGAAIALPLFQEGMSRRKAFAVGALSGFVEPVCAVLTVLVAGAAQPFMPWLLSFAAGAMLYVVVEELIPEANPPYDHQTHGGTIGVMAGFLIMMILDVALG